MLGENKKRKRRNKRGENTKKWEKLRQKPITGIDTLQSGGLVSSSAPKNNTNSVNSNEFGHTVTGLGGGIIPEITNGGLHNPPPTFTKVLPRLGRALRQTINTAKITGDQNPLTRIDGNDNGLLFDGTWREMPDPTPGNRVSLTGAMGRRDNPTKFLGLQNLLNKHFMQSQLFDEWEKNNDWMSFHRNHFDWWMFPIPRGSHSYGDGYNITGEPLQELLKNKEYISSLKKSVRQYLKAMAWDVEKNDWIENADIMHGQNPVQNINAPRLYKIAQSTYAHQLMDEHMSIRKMANDLLDNGINIGNEEYWRGAVGLTGRMAGRPPEDPDFSDPKLFPQNLTWRDRHKRVNLGPNMVYIFSGNHKNPNRGWVHASFWVDKTQLPEKGKKGEIIEALAADGVTKHFMKWNGTEWMRSSKGAIEKPKNKLSSSVSQGLSIKAKPRDSQIVTKPGSKELERLLKRLDDAGWDWKDENARRELVQLIQESQNRLTGDKPWSHGSSPKAANTKNDFIDELYVEFIKPLGIYTAQGTRGGHGHLGNAFGKWMALQSTPGDINGNATELGSFLAELDEQKNPNLFNLHFEQWIRDPLTTVTDPADGKQKGIRYVFGDDRQKMLKEYRARVSALRKAAFILVTGSPESGSNSEDVAEVSSKELFDFLSESEPQVISMASSFADDIIKNDSPRSLHRLHAMVMDRLSLRTTPEKSKLITPGVLNEIIKNSNPNFENTMPPEFFEPDNFGELPDATIDLAKSFAEGMLETQTAASRNSIVKELTELIQLDEPKFTEKHSQNIVDNAIANGFGVRGLSGKMKVGPENNLESDYDGFDTENPDSLGNHMLSRESSYEVLPEPTDNIEIAIAEGRPISWLIPGSYHPEIEKTVNEITDDVINSGYTSIEDFRETGTGDPDDISVMKAKKGQWVADMEYSLFKAGALRKDFELDESLKMMVNAILDQDVTRVSEIDFSVDPRGEWLQSQIESQQKRNMHEIALGLVQRAIVAGVKSNFLAEKSRNGGKASDETIEYWNKAIGAALENNAPFWSNDTTPTVSVGMPVQAVLNLLNDGKFKTLHETGISLGNSRTDIRRIQEFALFGIHPESFSRPRPIYGILAPGGLSEEAMDMTSQYGPIHIVLKPNVADRSTWTESDSLSLASTASSIKHPTHHGLFAQNIHGELEQFMKPEPAYDDEDIGRMHYTEAQIHGGITLDDISHIVVNDDIEVNDWHALINFPSIDGSKNGDQIQSIDEYEPFIQISKIAESKGIPIIRKSQLGERKL